MSETKPRKRAKALPSATDYLDSLIPAQAGERDIEGLKLIERSRIALRPQARRTFASSEMRELAASIRTAQENGQGIASTGIFVPLLVVPAEDGAQDGYALVAGERRFRASETSPQWIGVPQLPCLLMRADARGIAVAQMIENLQRQGLPPLEEASGIQNLMREQGLSIRDVAKALGKDKGYLENRLRLLKMGDDLQAMVSSREDTLKHAYYIDQVRDAGLRRQLIKAVLEDRASVSQVRGKIGPPPERRAGTGAATAGPGKAEEAPTPIDGKGAGNPSRTPDAQLSAPTSSASEPQPQVLVPAEDEAGVSPDLAVAEVGLSSVVELYIVPGIDLIEQGITRLSDRVRGQEQAVGADAQDRREVERLLESLRVSAQKLSEILR